MGSNAILIQAKNKGELAEEEEARRQRLKEKNSKLYLFIHHNSNNTL